MSYKKILILLLVLSSMFFTVKNYNKSKQFLIEISKEKDVIKESYVSLFPLVTPNFPVKKEDLLFYIKYAQGELDHKLNKMLEYGYDIKYDSISKSYVVYSFGTNKTNNYLKNTSFNFLDKDGFYQLKKFTFFNFLKSYNSDIILFNFRLDSNFSLCEYIKSPEDLFYSEDKSPRFGQSSLIHRFINGKSFSNFYNKNDESFRYSLARFEWEINKGSRLNIFNGYDKLKKSGDIDRYKILFFTYKNKKIEIVCNRGLPNKEIDELILQLENHFKTIDTSLFDYVIFPIYYKVDNGSE